MPCSINLLPVELLASILAQASCYCRSYPRHDVIPSVHSPNSYSAVCRYWRQVVVNHQSLWTHIELVVGVVDDDGKCCSPEIWIERSKGAPLYVEVFQPPFSLDEYIAKEGEQSIVHGLPNLNQLAAPMVERIVNFPSPLMPQVCSLTIFLSWPYESTLEKLLDCWAAHGTPGQAKVLKTLSHAGLIEFTIRSPESYGSFLESLEVLHLRNTVLPWSSFPFHNLVELEISKGEGQWTIAPPELARILSSCPGLRYLSLDDLIVEPLHAPQPNPILLTHLQELRIVAVNGIYKMDSASVLESVLAMIILGPDALNLDVTLSYICEPPQRAIDVVRAFVERTNVTQLRVRGCLITGFEDNPFFASQLGPLPRVQNLILENIFFCDLARVKSVLLDFDGGSYVIEEYYNPRPIHPELVLWPDIRNLYLGQCVLGEEHLHFLISLHSVQAMYMHDCSDNSRIVCASDVYSEDTSESQRSVERFVQLLSQIVPKVVRFPAREVTWSSLLP